MVDYFFIVGAQRSGSTYVYQLLDLHPDICMAKPAKPEPKFFLKTNLSKYSHDDYSQMYFDEDDTCKIRGEKSTSYIESESAVKQIASWFPSAKIIMILRNPIDRAISNYQFSVKNKLETLPIDEAFLKESERRDNYDPTKISVSPFSYLKRGLYIDYIRMYETYFPRDHMKILIHEEFVGKLELVQDLYHWIAVDRTYAPQIDLTIAVNASELQKQDLSNTLESYLIDYFASSVEQLEDYLDRSLSNWHHFA